MLNKEFEPKKFHFIGIGGVGMSGLAKYLLQMGAEVSGSDKSSGKYCEMVKKLGGTVYEDHRAENVPANSMVVLSTAVKEDNPELIRAKELDCGILHRSELLKLISMGFGTDGAQKFIGFAGTHGKTTTSGLCSYVLNKAGVDASYVVGGLVPEFATNADFKENGKFFVAELDESDGSIVKYSPNTVVINNLEADHPDFYKNGLVDVIATFKEFLSNIKPDAKVLLGTDSPGCCDLMKACPERKYVTYGLTSGDYRAENVVCGAEETHFDITYKGEKLCEMSLSLIGEHNVYNALAVAAAIRENGVDLNLVKPFFKDFTGMGRRFQKVEEFDGIKIFDDYAHHPSEVKATLCSAKKVKPAQGRIVTIFQPHRYTRFGTFWNEFLKTFEDTDKLIVVDVFSAGDEPSEKFNSENFVKQINHKDAVYVSGSIQEAAKKILPILKKNDIVITMGAGDITKAGKYLAEQWDKQK